MIKNFLSDDFCLEGYDKNDFLSALDERQEKVKHLNLSFKNMNIGHLEVLNDEIYIINMGQINESDLFSSNSPPKRQLIKKELIDEDILNKIINKQITTCLLIKQGNKNIPVFINEEARKYIMLRLSVKGSIFYDKSLLSDLALQKCLESYIEKDFDIFIILKEQNTLVLTSVVSKSFNNPYELVKKEINENNLLDFWKYKITNSQTMVELKIKSFEQSDLTFSIRYIMSDTGFYKRLLCIAVKNASRSCILKELDDTSIIDEKFIKNISKIFNELNKSNEKVQSPYSLLKNNKKVKSIGQKRLALIKKDFSFKSLTKREYLERILLLPDYFKSINPTTDYYLESGIGEIINCL